MKKINNYKVFITNNIGQEKIYEFTLKDFSGKKYDKYSVFINSCGGDFNVSCHISRQLEIIGKKIPVETISCGLVESGALLIFMSGKIRTAFKEDLFLFHNSSFVNGLKSETTKRLMKVESLCDKYWIGIMAKKTKKPINFWRNKYYSEEEFYFNGLEAYKLGVVNKLI